MMSFENFIMNGEHYLKDILGDEFYDEIPDDWYFHYVDEVVAFDDGFYTIVDYNNSKILYHIFVSPDARGTGVAKEMLKNAFSSGVRIVFDPNDICEELLMAMDQDEGITFKVVNSSPTCCLEEVEL